MIMMLQALLQNYIKITLNSEAYINHITPLKTYLQLY